MLAGAFGLVGVLAVGALAVVAGTESAPAAQTASSTETTPEPVSQEQVVGERAPSTNPKPTSTAGSSSSRPSSSGTSNLDDELGAGAGDLVYVSSVRDQLGGQFEERELTALGRQICSQLRAGRDPLVFGMEMMDNGVSAAHAGVFIGAAPPAYCPEMHTKVQAAFGG